MQTILVIIIVCLAAAYLARTFFGKSKTKNGCGCGCSACQTADVCGIKEAPATQNEKHDVAEPENGNSRQR